MNIATAVTNIAITRGVIAVTIWGAIQKRVHEPIYKMLKK